VLDGRGHFDVEWPRCGQHGRRKPKRTTMAGLKSDGSRRYARCRDLGVNDATHDAAVAHMG
jgi:hypothetical protein